MSIIAPVIGALQHSLTGSVIARGASPLIDVHIDPCNQFDDFDLNVAECLLVGVEVTFYVLCLCVVHCFFSVVCNAM